MDNFITQTAIDYDLPYETVEYLYKKYGATQEFYIELEKMILIRQNKF